MEKKCPFCNQLLVDEEQTVGDDCSCGACQKEAVLQLEEENSMLQDKEEK